MDSLPFFSNQFRKRERERNRERRKKRRREGRKKQRKKKEMTRRKERIKKKKRLKTIDHLFYECIYKNPQKILDQIHQYTTIYKSIT